MKKTIRKILFASLFVLTFSCLLAFNFTASAEVYGGDCGAEGDNVTWEFDSETGVLTLSGEGKTDAIDDTGMPYWYDYLYDTEKIVIGDNIVLCDRCFDYSNATEIIIGDNVTVCDYAFLDCYRLRKLTIGENAIIGNNAFCSMNSYEWLIETKIGSILKAGEMAFVGCAIDGTLVILDNAIIGEGAFSPDAFDDNYSKTLKKVIIGDNVSLGDNAFANNYALATVEINGKLKYVGEGVLDGTKIYRSSENIVEIDGAIFSVKDYIVYIEDAYYIVAKNALSYRDAYFSFGKTKWNEMNCGDENEYYVRKFNHKHSFEAEYDYNNNEFFTLCECSFREDGSSIILSDMTVEVTDTTAVLSWESPCYAGGYSIYKYSVAKDKWVMVEEECDMQCYTIKKLNPNTEYRYAVRMYNDYDGKVYAPAYNEIKFVTKLGKPELTVTGGFKHIKLSWKAVDGADGYRVYKKINGSWKALTYTSKLVYIENDISDSKKHTYAVKAYRIVDGKKVYADKYSSGSAVAVIKLANPKVTYDREMKSVTLNWNKVNAASGYRVYRLVNGKWKAIKTTTATSYTVNKLKADTKYSFAVRSYVKVNGSTKWASSYAKVTVTTLDYTPIKATGLKVGYISDSSIKISWNKSEDAAGYYVYKYNSSSKKYTVVAKTKGLSATLKDIDLSKTNYFTVRTYKKVDGKTYWSGHSAKLKVIPIPSTSKAVEIFNKSIMQGAYWFGSKPRNKELFDYRDTIVVNGYTYARIKSNKIKSADDLKAHLCKYYDEAIVNRYFEGEYSLAVNKNGKVYYMFEVQAGSSGGIELKYTECTGRSFSNGMLKCEFSGKFYEHSENKYYPVTFTAYFTLRDGNWVLADSDELGYIYGARWTGSSYNPHNL